MRTICFCSVVDIALLLHVSMRVSQLDNRYCTRAWPYYSFLRSEGEATTAALGDGGFQKPKQQMRAAKEYVIDSTEVKSFFNAFKFFVCAVNALLSLIEMHWHHRAQTKNNSRWTRLGGYVDETSGARAISGRVSGSGGSIYIIWWMVWWGYTWWLMKLWWSDGEGQACCYVAA